MPVFWQWLLLWNEVGRTGFYHEATPLTTPQAAPKPAGCASNSHHLSQSNVLRPLVTMVTILTLVHTSFPHHSYSTGIDIEITVTIVISVTVAPGYESDLPGEDGGRRLLERRKIALLVLPTTEAIEELKKHPGETN